MELMDYIKDIPKCSPLLLIGGYVPEFKRIGKGLEDAGKHVFNTFYLREKADMDEFVEDNSGRRFPSVLVIDIGVGLVPHVDGLLKFIEEYTGPLIVTSNHDINNLVFLSRFKLELRKSKEEVNFLVPSHKNTLTNDIDEGTRLTDPIIWRDYTNGMKSFAPLFEYYRDAEDVVLKCINIIYS